MRYCSVSFFGKFFLYGYQRQASLAKALSPIILLQNSLQVRQSVKYLSCNLRVWENAFVPIILQSAGREEKPFAYLSSCEIEFALKQGAVCLCCYLHTLCEVSDARNELFHFGCFSVYNFVFHSRGYWRLDLARSASTSSRL